MTALPGRQLWAELSEAPKPIPRTERAGHRLALATSITLLVVLSLMAGCGWLPGAHP